MHFSHYYIDKKGINMKRLLATSFTLVLIIGNAGMAILNRMTIMVRRKNITMIMRPRLIIGPKGRG